MVANQQEMMLILRQLLVGRSTTEAIIEDLIPDPVNNAEEFRVREEKLGQDLEYKNKLVGLYELTYNFFIIESDNVSEACLECLLIFNIIVKLYWMLIQCCRLGKKSCRLRYWQYWWPSYLIKKIFQHMQ